MGAFAGGRLVLTSVRTERLDLRPPEIADVPELFAILGDPRVWAHFPSLRHRSETETATSVQRWIDGWATSGLDTWVVRLRDDAAVIGYGGCSVLGGRVWNLGYRFAAEAQGHGFATEVAEAAIAQALALRPELPVIAYLLEHNTASANVARKVGLELVHRAPDRGNPDPSAVRLVFASRHLTPEELAATLR